MDILFYVYVNGHMVSHQKLENSFRHTSDNITDYKTLYTLKTYELCYSSTIVEDSL